MAGSKSALVHSKPAFQWQSSSKCHTMRQPALAHADYVDPLGSNHHLYSCVLQVQEMREEMNWEFPGGSIHDNHNHNLAHCQKVRLVRLKGCCMASPCHFLSTLIL